MGAQDVKIRNIANDLTTGIGGHLIKDVIDNSHKVLVKKVKYLIKIVYNIKQIYLYSIGTIHKRRFLKRGFTRKSLKAGVKKQYQKERIL